MKPERIQYTGARKVTATLRGGAREQARSVTFEPQQVRELPGPDAQDLLGQHPNLFRPVRATRKKTAKSAAKKGGES